MRALKSAIVRGLERRGYELRPPVQYATGVQFLYFKRMFDRVSDIEGGIVECGVGHGQSLLLFSFLLKDSQRLRKLWGFDSFQGFPEPSKEDQSVRDPKKGEWGDTSIPAMHKLLRRSGLDSAFVRSQITLVQGFFEESLAKYRQNIALLHIDVDLYDSYRTVLRELYPKVAIGGVILFDEYLGTFDHLHFPGAQKAIDEFFGEEATAIQRDERSGKYYLVKRKELPL